MAALAEGAAECKVYLVEVCQRCSWNHLVSCCVVGGETVRARRRAAGR